MSFIRSTENVLHLPRQTVKKEYQGERFIEYQYSSIAFQEYSP